MNILNVKTMVFAASSTHIFFIYFASRMIIANEIAECATPKTKSNQPKGENNRFYKNTPITIPKM